MGRHKIKRPRSYRRHVALILVVSTLVSGAFALLYAYFMARNTTMDELRGAETEAAETMLALYASTELSGDEIARMAASGGIVISRMLVDAAPLKGPQLQAMRQQGYVVLPNGALSAPVTYVLLGEEMFSIAPAVQFGLYYISFLRLISVWISFAAIFVLISLLAASRISRPVSALSGAVKQVSAGDFSVRLPENEKGEVGRLMRDFNRMTEALGHTAWLQKDFIANISHEFRTPIAAVKGYATLLQMEGLDEQQRKDFLQIIYDESDRLSRLSDTLLRLSALEHQASPDALTEVRVDEQIRQAIVRMEPVWAASGVEWELELAAIRTVTDADMLQQVWVNLLQNAIRFSPPNAVIEVRLRRENGQICAAFHDHGIGMDEETQKHIFERFYRADSARTSEGTGIGLTLVQRILTLLGGSIEVESAPGQGSTFTVLLPENRPDSRPASPAAKENS